MKLSPIQIEIRKNNSLKNAKRNEYYFKTGIGEYGEGDQFLGARNPDLRLVAKKFVDTTDKELHHLLLSPFNEDRLCALLILVLKYQKNKKNFIIQSDIVNFYIKHKDRVNNWNLVDTSASKIIGDFSLKNNKKNLILKLSQSNIHWDRRISMISTFAFIREKKLDLTFYLAKKFLKDKEDLMHKAVGWMLREAGKKDKLMLVSFLNNHGSIMPRTMLRYSIEKFSKAERKKILKKFPPQKKK